MRHYIQLFSQSSPVLTARHTKSYGAHCGSVYQHCEPKSDYKIYLWVYFRKNFSILHHCSGDEVYSGETPTQVIIMMREHLPAYNFQTGFQLIYSDKFKFILIRFLLIFKDLDQFRDSVKIDATWLKLSTHCIMELTALMVQVMIQLLPISQKRKRN